MPKHVVLTLLVLICSLRTNAADLLIPAGVSYTTSNYTASGTVGSATNRAADIWLANLRGQQTWRDLVIANDQDNTISVALCRDNGSFGALTNYSVGLNPRGVRTADINGDGYEDIICANFGTNTISILTNAGKGTSFVASVEFTVGATATPGPCAVAIEDVEGNGGLDIAVANELENTVTLLVEYSGSYFTYNHYFVGAGPRSVLFTDLNNDGRKDILTANKSAGTLTILTNSGSANFDLEQTVSLFPGGDPQPVNAWPADFNGDAIKDIAVANYASNSVSILVGNGSGGYTVFTNYTVNSSPSSMTVRDLNLDGKPDIAVACEGANKVDVLLSQGDGSFTTGHSFDVGSAPKAIASSNFNPDTVPDLATANDGDNTVSTLIYDFPRIYSSSLNAAEDRTNTVALTATIHHGRTPTYTIVSGPSQGTLNGTGASRTYLPNTNYIGADSFSFKVNDGISDSEVATVSINVQPVNDAPNFTLATNLVRVQRYGVANVVSNIIASSSPGPVDESGQTITFPVTVTNASFYSQKPTISAAGVLTYKPSGTASGTNYITVRAQDSGGTGLGGTNLSAGALLAIVVPTNPYPAIKGTYSGLFYETNVITHESAGAFTLNLGTIGSFTGNLKLGRSYGLKGYFNADGQSQVTVTRLVGPPLTVNLSIDQTGGSDQVTGTVTDGSWIADLSGDRATFNSLTNPAPQAGLYTMVLPGHTNSATNPHGDGYATITVTTAGKIVMRGVLADGTSFSQGSYVSKNGLWPLYVPLYSTRGSVISWITFSNQVNSALSGNLSWIKTAAAGGTRYTSGFTNEAVAEGSTFSAPAPGSRILNFTNAVSQLTGGSLTTGLTNNVILNTNNIFSIVNGGATNLVLKVATNGLVTGSFKHPVSGAITQLKGVVLQQQNQANGFFQSTSQSGKLRVQGN